MEQNQEKAQIPDRDIMKNIIDNYRCLEESIVSQLRLNNKYHGYTTGVSREGIWLQLFEQIIPKKFQIEQSVFIIDSKQHRSHEVDLAIIDNTYTPYIFHYGKLKFVPIEAVAAVIECKSENIKKQNLKKWCESIESLRTSRNSIARMATNIVITDEEEDKLKESPSPNTQTSTRPIRILCDYKSEIPPKGINNPGNFFDFIIVAGEEKQRKVIKVVTKELDDMEAWYKDLNHYQYDGNEKNIKGDNRLKEHKIEKLKIESNGKEEISLLTLNFQLNQLLMLLNNPILFPHQSYAEMFKKALENSDSCQRKS